MNILHNIAPPVNETLEAARTRHRWALRQVQKTKHEPNSIGHLAARLFAQLTRRHLDAMEGRR